MQATLAVISHNAIDPLELGQFRWWSGCAKVPCKLPVPGRPIIWMIVGQGPICACSRCGWRLFGHFYSPLSLLTSFSLSLGDDSI